MDAAKDRDGDSTPKYNARRSETLPDQPARHNADGIARTPATYVTASFAARRPEDALGLPSAARRASHTRFNKQQATLSVEDRSASWPTLAHREQFAGFQRRIESFDRRVNKVDRSRDKILLLRDELKFVRRHYRRQLEFVDRSHEALRKHIESMTTAEGYDALRDETDRLYAQARQDHLGLIENSKRLQDLEDELSSLEFNLAKQDRKLRYTTEKIFNLLRQLDPSRRDTDAMSELELTIGTSTDVVSDSEHTSADSGSSDIPEALATYHDKAGDVRVMQDRLFQVDIDYVEQLEQRARLEDQGQELAETEEAFEKRFNDERDGAQCILDEAMKARDDARYMCMNAGIDVEAARKELPDNAEQLPKLVNENDGRRPDMPSWLAFEEMDLPLEVLQLGIVDDESPFVTEVQGDQKADPQVLVEQWVESVAEHHETSLVERVVMALDSPRPRLQYRSSFPDLTAQQADGEKRNIGDLVPSQDYTPAGNDLLSKQHWADSRSRSSSASKLSSLLMRNASPPDFRRPSDEVQSRRTPAKS